MNTFTIFILIRGFVIICENVEQHQRDFQFLKFSGSCGIIRRWGTTKGIGELAIDGPTSSTTVDPEPEGTINKDHIIKSNNCTEKANKKWTSFFQKTQN